MHKSVCSICEHYPILEEKSGEEQRLGWMAGAILLTHGAVAWKDLNYFWQTEKYSLGFLWSSLRER